MRIAHYNRHPMGATRHLVERLSRGRSFWRRLPPEFGRAPILVSPDAALSYLKFGRDAFDKGLLAVVDEWVKPGSSVWDIGANVGVFGVAAAARAGAGGRVLCVEPDVWLAGLVQRSAHAQPQTSARINVLTAAVSEKAGVAAFLVAERGRASNSLESAGGRSQSGGARHRLYVPTVTADAIVETWGKPDLVKIDVEGAEAFVLQAARGLLENVRPVIYCEVGKEQADEVTALLRAASYSLFDPRRKPGERVALERCCFNTLAVPEGD